MDANQRDYGTYAAEATKQATSFLKTLGFEQKDIAKALDISFPYLARMLGGQQSMPHRHAVKLLALVREEVTKHDMLTFTQVGLLIDTAAAWMNALAAWHKMELGAEADDFLAWLETLPEAQQRAGHNYRNGRDKEVLEASKASAKLKLPWFRLWLYLITTRTEAMRRERLRAERRARKQANA